MTAYIIDTLEATEELKQAGFNTEQAKAMTKLVKFQGEQLATKADIAGVRQEVAGVRQEVTGLRWMFGLHFALTLVILGFLFAIWRDVSSLSSLMAGV